MYRYYLKFPVWVLLVLLALPVQARIDTYQFSTPQQESLYHDLTQELRCLVCQNQNIADSNAELAKDLRRKTYEMVSNGKNRDEIVDFMVTRYGDFVMYKPPLKPITVILWMGPAIILLVGIWVLLRIIRRRPSGNEKILTDEQRRKAEALLGQLEDK